MKATAAMTQDVICLSSDDRLAQAWDTMERFRIRHLPVFEGDVLVGIVSDRDLLLHGSPGADGALALPDRAVGEVMTPVPITCRPTATVAEVADLMLTHRIDCVPVCSDPRTLVGLVTSTDLVRLLREQEPGGRDSLPFEWRVVRDLDAGARR